MTSILKVDTLQKPDGTAPSASELGLNVAGSVVQVVTNTTSSTAATSSTTYSDCPNMNVTITPKHANSLILVFVNAKFSANENSQQHQVRLYRNGNPVGDSGNSNNFLMSFGAAGYSNTHFQNTASLVPDYPNTTSAVTYQVKMATGQGTMTFNYTGSNGQIIGGGVGYTVSTITAYEIAQ